MWTKSQKISAAVLALAVSAFAVDRWVLGTPADETAAAVAAPESLLVNNATSAAANKAGGPAAANALPTAAAKAAVTLASRLSALGEARRFSYEAAGDAFRPSDEWLASAKPPGQPEPANAAAAPVEAPKPVAKKVDYAAAFRARHALNAVMTKQSGGMAIVDGKLYAPGQTIDGFKLTRVGENEATFVGRGGTVTLRLTGQAGAKTGAANTATATAR